MLRAFHCHHPTLFELALIFHAMQLRTRTQHVLLTHCWLLSVCLLVLLLHQAGDAVSVAFDFDISIYEWTANRTDGSFSGSREKGSPPGPNGGSIEVHRGPITYALRPTSTVKEQIIGCIGGKPDGRCVRARACA